MEQTKIPRAVSWQPFRRMVHWQPMKKSSNADDMVHWQPMKKSSNADKEQGFRVFNILKNSIIKKFLPAVRVVMKKMF